MRAGTASKAVIVLLVIVIAGLVAYQFHLIPNLNSSDPLATPVNTQQSPLDANQLAHSYLQNQAQEDSQYTGKTAYISGSVGNVEKDQSGSYVSCVDVDSASIYGCGLEQDTAITRFINWNWKDSTAAAKVPFQTSFIAECQIGGLSNLNLILNNCQIVTQ
jgi:hypothetical protein